VSAPRDAASRPGAALLAQETAATLARLLAENAALRQRVGEFEAAQPPPLAAIVVIRQTTTAMMNC
jgi:hypothetical protein